MGRAGDDRALALEGDVHARAAGGFGRTQFIQGCPGERPPAVLDIVDELDQPRGQRRGDAMAPARLDDRRELGLDLGLALAHGKVAPDAAMGLGRAAVEGDHVVEGGGRGRHAGTGQEGRGIEAVEGLGLDARRDGHGHDLAAQRDQQRAGDAAEARQSAMESSVRAVANSIAP